MVTDPPPIVGVSTSTAGFAGDAGAGPDPPALVTSVAEFEGLASAVPAALGRMVRGFFANGGTRAYVAGTLAALETVDEIALLCPLPEQSGEAIAQCERRRDRVAILSLPAGLGSVGEVLAARPSETSAFAAVHYPWVRAGGELTPPGGHVAGVYASGEVKPVAEWDRDPRSRRSAAGALVALVRDCGAGGRGRQFAAGFPRLWPRRAPLGGPDASIPTWNAGISPCSGC